MAGRLAVVAAALIASLAPLSSGATSTTSTRSLRSGPSPVQIEPIELSVTLDRVDPIYALDDPMKLRVRTARSAAIRLWEIYPDGTINSIAKGMCYKTVVGVPLVLPMTVGPPLGVTELHVQAFDLSLVKRFCRRMRSSRSFGSAADHLPWSAQMQETILRYTVVRPGGP